MAESLKLYLENKMKTLDLSQNGINLQIDITDDGFVVLNNFSRSNLIHKRSKHTWGPIAEIHLCGDNPNDHHMAKHTGGSATFTLKYKSHKYYENEFWFY